MRTIAVAVLAALLQIAVSDGVGAQSETDAGSVSVPSDLAVEADEAPGPLSQSSRQISQCCKVCKKGKACGDSCISKNKTCHKPPGCACDAN